VSGTRRTPIARRHRPPVSLTAIKIFEEMMERCPCTCDDSPSVCGDFDKHPFRDCPGCKRWWELHSHLSREVRAKPWEYPCIEDPDAGNPEPPGTYNYTRWKPDERGHALWRALEEGVRQMRREERARRHAAAAAQPPPPPEEGQASRAKERLVVKEG